MIDELGLAREEYPAFRIWRDDSYGRSRYIVRSLYPGLNPHTVVTHDLDELRSILPATDRHWSTAQAPNVARIYDCLLQGKDHYAADRATAAQILREFPEARHIAQANRAFLARAVRHVAAQGVCQFIDLGSGLPTAPNIHETARVPAPDARVAYVDRDPVVLAYARALLAVRNRTAVVAGDLTEPASVLADPALAALIDLTEPVCVLLTSVLHFLPASQADATVTAIRQHVVPGSYLVITAGTSTGTEPALIRSLQTAYAGTADITGRTQAEISAWFDGLDLASPGLTEVWAWRPDRSDHVAGFPSVRARFLAGVARKPIAARAGSSSCVA